jgi:hypothetical protein
MGGPGLLLQRWGKNLSGWQVTAAQVTRLRK